MARLAYAALAPEGMKALLALHGVVGKSGIGEPLRYLVELRVSQLNGCAFCVDLHSEQCRQHGIPQQRLDAVSVWRESPFFTPRERAALAWAETVTLIAQTHVPDEAFEAARAAFTDKELVDLTLVVGTMNALNRMAATFRREPALRE